MKNLPGIIYKLRCLGCMHFKSEQTLMFCREENFVGDIEVNFPSWSSSSFSTKRKRSILLNITFLSASSNSTLVILLREKKKKLSIVSWEMVPVHEEKIVMHKLLSKHHDVMYKKLRPCALPPAGWWGVPRRIARHRRLKTEPMLLRDLHNSSHHTQPHSVIVK